MHHIKKWTSALLLSAMALISQPLLAEQFVAHDNYEIHYNAFYSTFIQPDVAQAIGIQRSKRRALVNVSVLQKEDGEKKPVTAIVKGKATNLIQQVQTMDFKKVDEGNAIYYIGQFGFTDDQVMRISLDVQPDPNKPAYTVKFEQRFYEE
ncbi:DUF4426 domain-containing protein [Neptuniibacter sp. QD37_6]|uniref:DUF4426 domain-containing protein n=1 Tax=Neptuniibacter sp. QD37_6 TaxID=3398210 RepID=UPI0039F58876